MKRFENSLRERGCSWNTVSTYLRTAQDWFIVMFLLQRYMNRDVASPYLFPILRSGEGTEEAYREYQLALRGFNHQLALLGELWGIKGRLSS